MALLERSLSKARGSSKGSARIFAPAAYPDESYLELALRALARWREIESESGERLLWTTGALTQGEFAEREMSALRAAGVEAEFLTAEDAARRFGVRAPGSARCSTNPTPGSFAPTARGPPSCASRAPPGPSSARVNSCCR